MKKVLHVLKSAVSKIDSAIDHFFADLKHRTAKELIRGKLVNENISWSDKDVDRVARKLVARASA